MKVEKGFVHEKRSGNAQCQACVISPSDGGLRVRVCQICSRRWNVAIDFRSHFFIVAQHSVGEKKMTPSSEVTTMNTTDRPSYLRTALHLNNKAAVQIIKSEYEQAISTLSSALMSLKDAIRLPCDDSVALDETPLPKGRPLNFLIDDYNTMADDLRSSLQDRLDVEQDWYLYRYPVQVSSESCNFKSTDCIQLLSFAGIYNLGLCHHLQALVVSHAQHELHRQRLTRAASFYEHAQRLISSDLESMDPDMIHSLVIANNLGHAHFLMGNETNGKMCFQQLLNTIMYLSDNVGSENLVALDKDRWDGFMVNIIQHVIGRTSAAAAA